MKTEPVENQVAKVDFEEARVLADLGAIVQDLGAVMQTCSRLKELLRDESKDHILIEALWTSALIRYARCFAESKRFGLSESVFDDLQGDPLGAHQFYMDLRNKHIAHSVNPFEQMEVGLVLSPATNTEKGIIGVATLAMRQISSDVEGVHQLGLLAKVVLGKAHELAKHYEQKTLKIAKKMPLDDLYKRSRPRLIAPGPELTGAPGVKLLTSRCSRRRKSGAAELGRYIYSQTKEGILCKLGVRSVG